MLAQAIESLRRRARQLKLETYAVCLTYRDWAAAVVIAAIWPLLAAAAVVLFVRTFNSGA